MEGWQLEGEGYFLCSSQNLPPGHILKLLFTKLYLYTSSYSFKIPPPIAHFSDSVFASLVDPPPPLNEKAETTTPLLLTYSMSQTLEITSLYFTILLSNIFIFDMTHQLKRTL